MRYVFVMFAFAVVSSASGQSSTKKPSARAPTPAITSAPAVAAGAEVRWDKEPDAFLGIRFNEPFNLASCPTKTYGQYAKSETIDYEAIKSLDGVCLDTTDTLYKYQRPESATYKLAHLPDLGFGYTARVHTKTGSVSEITIDLNQSNFKTLLAAFKDRYGEPTSVDSNLVKSKVGAEFSAVDVTWRGKKLSIRMYERMGKVDESRVVISDNEIMEAEINALRAKRAAEAQKF
jgi:hypothetical protein